MTVETKDDKGSKCPIKNRAKGIAEYLRKHVTRVAGVFAALAIGVVLFSSVGSWDVPVFRFRNPDGPPSEILIALLAFAAWAGLSWLSGSLLIPSSWQPMEVAKSSSKESIKDDVAPESSVRSEKGSVPVLLWKEFEETHRYVQAGSVDHSFYLAACASANEAGYLFKDTLIWWAVTHPRKVPSRGRPNHYFAITHLPQSGSGGNAQGDQSGSSPMGDILVIEVLHAGRAGQGASPNPPNIFTVTWDELP